MKFSIFATAFALASTAVASPTGCINMKQANQLVTRFIGIQNHQGSDLGDAQTTAEKLLTKNYEEISDSILSLEQQPVMFPIHYLSFLNTTSANPTYSSAP